MSVVNLETKPWKDGTGHFPGLTTVMEMVLQCSDEVKVYFMLHEAVNAVFHTETYLLYTTLLVLA